EIQQQRTETAWLPQVFQQTASARLVAPRLGSAPEPRSHTSSRGRRSVTKPPTYHDSELDRELDEHAPPARKTKAPPARKAPARKVSKAKPARRLDDLLGNRLKFPRHTKVHPPLH